MTSPTGRDVSWIEWREKALEVKDTELDKSRASFIGAVRPREGVDMVVNDKNMQSKTALAEKGKGAHNTAYALKLDGSNKAEWTQNVPNTAVLRTQEKGLLGAARERDAGKSTDLATAVGEMWLSRMFGKASLWPGTVAPGPTVYKYWIVPSEEMVRLRGADAAKQRLHNVLKGTAKPNAASDTVLSGSLMDEFDGSLSDCIADSGDLTSLAEPCAFYLKSQARNQIIDRIRQVTIAKQRSPPPPPHPSARAPPRRRYVFQNPPRTLVRHQHS